MKTDSEIIGSCRFHVGYAAKILNGLDKKELDHYTQIMLDYALESLNIAERTLNEPRV